MSSPPPQEFGRQEEEKEEKGHEEKGQEEEGKDDDPKPEDDPNNAVEPKRKRKRTSRRHVNDQSKIVDIQSLPANALLEAPFLKQTALQVKVFVGNKVYVANTGKTDVSIPVGTFLCGYGIGKFDRNTKGNFNPDCHLMFKIKTCDDFVFTSKMVTVKEVVAAVEWNSKLTKNEWRQVWALMCLLGMVTVLVAQEVYPAPLCSGEVHYTGGSSDLIAFMFSCFFCLFFGTGLLVLLDFLNLI